MGLLRLLSLPIRAPFDAALWIAQNVHDAAEAERNSPAALKARLDELERALDAGRITEEEFDAEEADLLMWLRNRGAAPGAADGGPEGDR